MGDGPSRRRSPPALRYEQLLAAAEPGAPEYPELDEREAAALCYTSGHDRQPQGRALLAPLEQRCTPPATLMTRRRSGSVASDRVLVVVPMFHANAWGLPYAAALAGATWCCPGRFLQAEPLGEADRGRALRR